MSMGQPWWIKPGRGFQSLSAGDSPGKNARGNSEWSTGLAEDCHIKISTGELGNKTDLVRRKVFHSENCAWVDMLNSGGCSSIKVYRATSNSQKIGTGRYYLWQPPWSRRKKMAAKNLGKIIFEGPNTEYNEIKEDFQGCVLDQT